MKRLFAISGICLAAWAHAEHLVKLGDTDGGNVVLYVDSESFTRRPAGPGNFLTGIFRMTEGTEADMTQARVLEHDCVVGKGTLTFRIPSDDATLWVNGPIAPKTWRAGGTTFTDKIAMTLCATRRTDP